MTGATIGSVNVLPAQQGRLGVVVGAQRVGAPKDGRQLVALKIKTVGAPRCDNGAKDEPLAAGRSNSAAGALTPGILDRDGGGPRPGARGYEQLNPEERAVVDRLRQRDAQVKQEEKAHAAVAGDLAGPISYVYQRGPDGRLYAVGGSVPLQAQTVSDPQEAARIGARMAAAGQAATNPSGADLAAVRAGYRLQGEPERQAARQGLDVTA